MKTILNITIYLLIFQMVLSFSAYAQEPLEYIKSKTEEYNRNVLQEKIYAHTDKEFYVAGEIIWFKLYCVEANSNKLIDQSKVAYVELIDQNNAMALHVKIELDSGKGNGSFVLPSSVHSGIYKLKAYTNWMKNFGPDRFFEKQVMVVNTFRKPEWSTLVKSDSLKVHFYPEGGNLVANVTNHVAFQLTDQYGDPAEGTGFIIENEKDTVLSFQPSKFGLGSFDFTPNVSKSYEAIIRNSTITTSAKLPVIFNSGYALHVSMVNNNEINVSVRTNEINESQLYLFIQHNDSIENAVAVPIKDHLAVYSFDLKKCKEGLSRITVFDKDHRPVCERLIWKNYEHPGIMQLSTDKSSYGLRSKVQLEIKPTANESDLSVSVYQIDSLQRTPDFSIVDYLLLSSELNGKIDGADYFLKHPEDKDAMELLLLTHGWTRYRWEDILSASRGFSFVPEYEGLHVMASIQSGTNSLNNKVVNLSVPSSKFIFTNSTTSDSGEVHFVLDKIYGVNEMIIQPANLNDSIYRLNIHNPYSEQYSSKEIRSFGLNEQWKDVLTRHHINAQVQNSFTNAEKYNTTYADSSLFYSIPDASYLLDDYTRFPTMEEVMREFVNKVRVRRNGSIFHYQVMNIPYKDYFDADPLVLLDGVPVPVNRIIQFDPLKVKRIDVMARKYFYRNAVYNGIVSYVTYTGDLPGYELDPHSVVIEYEGLQLRREFYSPDYNNVKNLRQPDRRNVLFWNGDIRITKQGHNLEFFTSDIPGKYLIRVEGIDKNGHPLVADQMIEVAEH